MTVQKLTGYSMMVLGAGRLTAGIAMYIETKSYELEDALVIAALVSHGFFGLFFGAYTAGSHSQFTTQLSAFTELVSSGLYTVCIAGGMGEPWAWWGMVIPVWYMGLIIASAANPIPNKLQETLVEDYHPIARF